MPLNRISSAQKKAANSERIGQIMGKVYIIGIGDDGLDGLTRTAISHLEAADLILGQTSLLAKVEHLRGRKEPITSDLDQLANLVDRFDGGDAVLLTYGDPLFYGTARFLCDRLGKERFEVLPHVSSMQLAFARVKENWEDAYLSSVANQPLDTLIDRIRTSNKVGLFTSDQITPQVIAQRMLAASIDYFTIYVCENIGSPNERVTRGTVEDISKQRFSPLNVLVLIRKPGAPDRPRSLESVRLFGNRDDLFLQAKPKRGLLTGSEIRSLALSELELQNNSVMWDIGAGSGSVAIEAAQLCRDGHVYAIEMDADDFGLLQENAARFGVRNLTPVLGEAPNAFAKLPIPEAVFVGGTGRAVLTICESVWSVLPSGGRLVANVSSLNNVVSLQEHFSSKYSVEPEVWMVQISKLHSQLDTVKFESNNPAFLVKLLK
jgi:precorrin-6B C5,15-methyltransferase / cobalt-precorrin-6B C5,C15-methyltransferase